MELQCCIFLFHINMNFQVKMSQKSAIKSFCCILLSFRTQDTHNLFIKKKSHIQGKKIKAKKNFKLHQCTLISRCTVVLFVFLLYIQKK